ncbi:3-isopropylmalate dehydratase, small subunit [Sulfitobacter noctilucae]|uniref:3-isopropylmalate dehydratase small subunit n=1 Tax=Sulfitobacter noctilucae TaxID=1342302 RepID=UPI00046A34DF|nr:3-isopropylmalate dehydratase small subunit [Sulfitobacter noctilucae]KIN70477.1 3-isopropylmalate dehydratase, small subunit [Sulfitobacter noctilucae]
MAGWSTYRGSAVSLPLANVDTDQLIPARFMSAPRSEGYGKFLLHDMRRDDSGADSADFVLNRHQEAGVLVAGRNFGSGSSREAAVYALVDAGFRAVIAPAFGDIFASNAVNNGLLPAQVTAEDAEVLHATLGKDCAEMTIDLETGVMTLGNRSIPFQLRDSWRTKLINGWDDIDLTLHHAGAIAAYKDKRHSQTPWAWPSAAD